MCSWLTANQTTSITEDRTIASVPSIKKIQQTLVEIGDKPDSFLNSREWIGALEVRILAPRLCWCILIYSYWWFCLLRVWRFSIQLIRCMTSHAESSTYPAARNFGNSPIFSSHFSRNLVALLWWAETSMLLQRVSLASILLRTMHISWLWWVFHTTIGRHIWPKQ